MMRYIRLLTAALFMLPLFLLSACEGGGEAEKATTPTAESARPAEAAPPAPEAAGKTEITSQLDDPVVVTVNQAPITRQLLDSQVVMAESGRMIFGDDIPEDEDPEAKAAREAADLNLRREVLGGLISLELACQEALKMGYAPTDEELEAALSDLRDDYDDPDQFHKVLDQYGETEDDLRAQLRKTMALKKWQDGEFLAKVEITEAEAQEFYQANLESMRHGEMLRASQIFIGIPIASMSPDRQDKAQARAQAALKALNAGEAFEEVALRFSDDPDVAATLGNLGWLDRESFAAMFNESIFGLQKGEVGNLGWPDSEPSNATFSETIFSLKKGEISEIVETPLGYYIFKITDSKAAGVEPFETAKPDIIEYLAEIKLTEALRQRMLELEAAADIKILDPALEQIMQTPAPEPEN